MINKEFAKNWTKFINLSSRVAIASNPLEIKQKLRVPLTPIELNGYLLYSLLEDLYPKFINDQLNVMDLIVSDYEIDNLVLGAYYSQMSKPGVYESLKELNKNDFKLKFKDLDNYEQLFTQINSELSKKYNLMISHIRIIKKRGIDLINRHVENLSKFTISELIESVLDLIQVFITNDLLIMYPEPPIIIFLRNWLSIIENIKLSQVFHYLFDLLPRITPSIILESLYSPILIASDYSPSKQESKEISLLVQRIEVKENIDLFLKKKRLELKSDFILSFSLSSLINYFMALFETPNPFEQEKIKLFLQKLLFGIRSYQTHWNISPKPLVTNVLMRFFLKLIGIELNLYKLSHWAIPEFFFNLINPYSGMAGTILLLITNTRTGVNDKSKILLIGFENGTIINIQKLDSKDIATEINTNDLDMLKRAFSKRIGNLTLTIKIEEEFLKFLIGTAINLHKLNILKLIKLVRLLKHQNYFELYPPIPVYTLLKSKSTFYVLRRILAIFFDKHNF